MKEIRIEDRLAVQVKLLEPLQGPREAWASFIERLLPTGTGVWIDDVSFVIPSPTGEWTLETLVISAPDGPRPTPPSDLDGTKLQEWLSLVQACAADPKETEFLVKWRRMADSKARFEAVTASREAATKLRDRLRISSRGAGLRPSSNSSTRRLACPSSSAAKTSRCRIRGRRPRLGRVEATTISVGDWSTRSGHHSPNVSRASSSLRRFCSSGSRDRTRRSAISRNRSFSGSGESMSTEADPIPDLVFFPPRADITEES